MLIELTKSTESKQRPQTAGRLFSGLQQGRSQVTPRNAQLSSSTCLAFAPKTHRAQASRICAIITVKDIQAISLRRDRGSFGSDDISALLRSLCRMDVFRSTRNVDS